uniref:Uncharacterized protein n=1 Tax=Arundo donax TaxID=35708 RepID=A0A0A9C5T7_ARUDO
MFNQTFQLEAILALYRIRSTNFP